MWGKEEENYWTNNQLSSASFSWDEETDTDPNNALNLEDGEDSESNVVFNENISQNKTDILSLEKFINSDSLDSILKCDIPPKDILPTDTVHCTIKALILSQRVDLNFKFISEKILLLDKSIESKRGNIIKKVVAYLDKTLLPKIFYQLLITRPTALNHLELYHIENKNFDSLSLLYTITGSFSSRRIFHLYCPSTKKSALNLSNLRRFQMQYEPLLNNVDMDAIRKYQSFLEHQIETKSSYFQSTISYFANYASHNDITKLDVLSAKFGIETGLSDWIIMNVYMSLKRYDKLQEKFLTKPKSTTWLLKNLTTKSILQPETLVLGMGKHKPGVNVLAPYLNLVSDEAKPVIGHKLGCVHFVIKYYCDKRDRNGLIAYKKKFPATSEYIECIDTALRDMTIKWKN